MWDLTIHPSSGTQRPCWYSFLFPIDVGSYNTPLFQGPTSSLVLTASRYYPFLVFPFKLPFKFSKTLSLKERYPYLYKRKCVPLFGRYLSHMNENKQTRMVGVDQHLNMTIFAHFHGAKLDNKRNTLSFSAAIR